MRIALVHDYLREYGGAERVVEALHEIWPDAPLYTSFVDWKSLGSHAGRFRSWDIRTSWVQKYPLIKRWISPLRFLAPKIWESFDLSGYDVVLTSSGWFIPRGVIVKKPAVHICYIHHPPRNLYGYATGSDLTKYWPVRVYAAIVNFFLRHYDFDTAQRVDYFIANSRETARRVKKFYRRESTVIYPPIRSDDDAGKRRSDDEKGTSSPRRTVAPSQYFLCVGRLTYAKRIDIAIEACNTLKVPLKIVGVGKEEKYLRSIAGPTVEFLGAVSDAELGDLYRGAKALIFSALDEDFGMVPVEAMAKGTPVIALKQGGVMETVTDGKTGVFFDKPEKEACMSAIQRFSELSKTKQWEDDCLKGALQFDKKIFQQKISEFIRIHGVRD